MELHRVKREIGHLVDLGDFNDVRIFRSEVAEPDVEADEVARLDKRQFIADVAFDYVAEVYGQSEDAGVVFVAAQKIVGGVARIHIRAYAEYNSVQGLAIGSAQGVLLSGCPAPCR